MIDLEVRPEMRRVVELVSRERPLREIVDHILRLAEVDETGELTTEACEALDALNLTLEEKVEAYHVVHEQLREECSANKSLEAYYACRARVAAARADRLKARLFEQMQRLGTSTVKTKTVRASIELSPESVEIDEGTPIDALPPECVITERKVSKRTLQRLLLDGVTLPYARLVRGTHLRFR